MPPGPPGWPTYPTQPSGRASLNFEKASRPLSDLPGRHPEPSRTFARVSRHLLDQRGASLTSGWASRSLPDLRESLQTLPGSPRGPPDHSWTSTRYSQPLPTLRKVLPTPPWPPAGPTDPYRTSKKVSQLLPDLREGLPNPPIPTRGPLDPSVPTQWPPDPSQTSGRASRPLPDLQESLPTPPEPPGGPPKTSPKIQKGHLIPTGVLGGSLDPSRRFVRAMQPLTVHREGLPDLWKTFRTLPNLWEGLLPTPGPPGWPLDPSRPLPNLGRASRTFGRPS